MSPPTPPIDGYESIIARHYDELYAVMRNPSGDVAFYGELARASGGPVLELGCGTGRTLLPIAKAGLDCVGVDASPAMLAVLRQKSPPPNLELVEARMESLELPNRRFRLVTCPFRAFSHLLDVESQLAALAAVRRQLEPGRNLRSRCLRSQAGAHRAPAGTRASGRHLSRRRSRGSALGHGAAATRHARS